MTAVRGLVLSALLLLSLLGCGATDNAETSRAANAARQNSLAPAPPPVALGQDGSAGAGSGAGFDNPTGNMTPPPIVATPPPGAGLGEEECAATAQEAKQIVVEETITTEEVFEEISPVALYVVLDQSASMNTGGLWPPATDALRRFVADEGSTGIDIALEFFPPNPEEAGECSGAGYDSPAVPMGRLPDHAADVTALLDSKPNALGRGGTPIEGGLRGGLSFCQGFEADHEGERCVVVLVTDGSANTCAEEADELAAIAEEAYAGGSGIRTFPVGLEGADFALLDAIAKVSGAVDCDEQDEARFACDVSSGPEKLADALSRIREVVRTVETHTEVVTKVEETPLECEWELPPPPSGQSLDPNKVNVQLSGSGSVELMLGQVPSRDLCRPMGWHYDQADAPTRVVACDQTCKTIQATPGARVDILLGCETVPLE